jgi:hypothetical protein
VRPTPGTDAPTSGAVWPINGPVSPSSGTVRPSSGAGAPINGPDRPNRGQNGVSPPSPQPKGGRSGPVVGRSALFEGRSGGFDRQRRGGIPHTRPRLGDGSIGLERRSHRPVDASGCAAARRRAHADQPQEPDSIHCTRGPEPLHLGVDCISPRITFQPDRLIRASMRRDPVESVKWLSILATPASVRVGPRGDFLYVGLSRH